MYFLVIYECFVKGKFINLFHERNHIIQEKEKNKYLSLMVKDKFHQITKVLVSASI